MEITLVNDALSLITKAEIDVQISTAKAFPRSLKNFMDKAMSIATINESVADSCSYALPRGDKMIEGPSVRLAEIVASSYGNVRYGARVIANDGKKITAQGICHDLESNTSATIEVSRSILQHEWKSGKKTGNMITMNDDMQVLAGNAASAIALRNAIFKVIPAALVDDIYQQTKKLVAGNAETLVAKRDKAISHLRSIGVKDEQVCNVLNIKRIEDIDLEKLSVLRGMVSAIKNGESTIKDMFDPEVPNWKQDIKPVELSEEFKRSVTFLQDCENMTQLKNLRTQIPIERFTIEEAAEWNKLISEAEKKLS